MNSNKDGRGGENPLEKKFHSILDNPNEAEDVRVTRAISFLNNIPDQALRREMRDKVRDELKKRCWKVLKNKQKEGLL